MSTARHSQHVRRLGDYNQLAAVDSETNQLIQYQQLDSKAGTQSFLNFKIDASAFSERDSVQVRSDLLDVGIYISVPPRYQLCIVIISIIRIYEEILLPGY
eukprot:TRINITY_DN110554_c0_g1_i1.p3 TRINITY_DN110554_c0_g1~~TRINITY_DN110554_c0_g1_i1.p3  ORF type:complete len:101 (-),score=8.22 TRINITY_DN110554_c0_g1_i1:244-546(-)